MPRKTNLPREDAKAKQRRKRVAYLRKAAATEYAALTPRATSR